MNLMFREICNCIELMTGFVQGTNFFAGWRPDNAPRRCIVALESAGGEVYGDLPDRVDQHIQIISRGETWEDAREDSYTVFEALHGKCCKVLPIESGSVWINQIIDALQSPQYIGQDDKGNFEFSTNYVWIMQHE